MRYEVIKYTFIVYISSRNLFRSVVVETSIANNMFLLLSLILAVWLLYKWLVSDFDYFAKQGIPFVKPYPFVGSALGPMMQKESIVDLTTRYYDQFKNSKLVYCYDLELLRHFMHFY